MRFAPVIVLVFAACAPRTRTGRLDDPGVDWRPALAACDQVRAR